MLALPSTTMQYAQYDEQCCFCAILSQIFLSTSNIYISRIQSSYKRYCSCSNRSHHLIFIQFYFIKLYIHIPELPYACCSLYGSVRSCRELENFIISWFWCLVTINFWGVLYFCTSNRKIYFRRKARTFGATTNSVYPKETSK